MPKKKEPDVIDVKDFETWTERVKSFMEIKRPNGKRYRFAIYSLDGQTRKELADEYQENLPPRPQRRLNKDGKSDMNDPFYEEAIKKYEGEEVKITEILKLRYIEEGFAKPNGFEIPGDSVKEKIENIGKVIAGDIDQLYLAIARLSNLGTRDVDFFSEGFGLTS